MSDRPHTSPKRQRGLCAALFALALTASAAWLGGIGSSEPAPDGAWKEVLPGVLRSPGVPAGYALVDGDAALLIDAPRPADGLRAQGVKKIERVLLTHHHRDSCAAAAGFLADRVPVLAAEKAAEWLLPENVRKYWKDSIPLRSSNTAYLVLPVGLDGVECSLKDGQTLTWHGWAIQVLATPGHSRDHLAFAARKGDGPLVVFCGDALAAPGKLWSPYTTDWDHWTDAGLKPAAESLRKLAALKPSVLLPAHGEVIAREAAGGLERTAAAVEEVGFLKSFERYTKQRLGNLPAYRFLAKEQAGSAGEKPWSQLSEHLFYTGNTYVLHSKEDRLLVFDPWGKRSVEQIAKLRADRKLGPVERVMFSHAHYDHYDGVYDLPERDRFEVWALDRVAAPLAEPFYYRAPFLDARPIRFERRFQDGETGRWREYTFRFRHFPGQTEFTMAVETTIDGKKCLFTGDNFFHVDLYSGTGGWMGLNRSWPSYYAASAQLVLDMRPELVLAEHGGAFEFDAEDFRRRVDWGKAGAKAADALCVSGKHRHDWDPHRVHVEPLVQKAKPGATLKGTLVASNALERLRKLSVTLEGRGLTPDLTWEVDVRGGETTRREFTLRLAEHVTAGRHVFALRAVEGNVEEAVDGFLVVDVEP